ncbi:PREDICTED: uncharacterized protein LOC108749608 isoform X2 [Trachymyrmex septentrionalis]|uniref:uncharacterized protein LOC108749608 isoform X2 n=1 Tax=Trachymyrmex septentrionalis TaxID=34720 RepID=UPI00084F6BED|nr:PREDICTED: uncharacterized protein LOC108749608 isoform X2 [Trachymyrmex septentrionalis]
MDEFINIQQGHKYGTCLCFSVMGRKKFRISICAISASPEAGDAPISIMSSKRKYSTISGTRDSKTFLSQRDKNRIIRHASIVPSDLINVARDYGGDSSLRKPCNIESEVDYCGFSYYRTDGFQDVVLVKDVGISCNLLNKNTVESDISISEVENYLIKQLKLEYNELSNITKTLNMYTKDILNNLLSRCRRKEQLLEKLHVASKHVMATQCTDKIGNPCLKLRSRNGTKRKYGSFDIDLDKSSVRKEITRKKMHGNNNTEKRWVEFNKAFVKRFLELSSKCSGVLLRNYLIMKREKVSSNASKARLDKTENFSISGKLCENRATDRSRKCFYASKCNPLMFTNWQEISKQKNCRSKSAFTVNTSELRRTINRI